MSSSSSALITAQSSAEVVSTPICFRNSPPIYRWTSDGRYVEHVWRKKEKKQEQEQGKEQNKKEMKANEKEDHKNDLFIVKLDKNGQEIPKAVPHDTTLEEFIQLLGSTQSAAWCQPSSSASFCIHY